LSNLTKYLENIGAQYTIAEDPICRFNRAAFSTLADLERFYIHELDHPLKQTALNTVFSNHKPHAQIMLIGEAPGAEEDARGEPFVGKSGQLLTALLDSIGLSREDVYITNLVPWRPPGNRNPTPEEMALFLPYLHKHIQLMNPVCIVLLGSIVTKALFGEHVRISAFRGQIHDLLIEDKKYPVLPTFHPSYLLRSPRQKKLAWIDMQLLKGYANTGTVPNII
jgi:uracil-DNA glycosylase family 4